MTIKDLKIGQSGLITKVGGEGALRQHFLDMGVIPGTEVFVVQYAPMGDPVELRIRGYELTLRLDDAARIDVEPIETPGSGSSSDGSNGDCREDSKGSPHHFGNRSIHPSLGEPGVHHVKGDEKPIPDGSTMRLALVGNQNCGKTTLFNCLTGANQHVGNFPGVTIDRKEGTILGHPNTTITDLPGIYSMSPYSSEELVSRSYILDEKPEGLINIIDATNVERNLYLTMQLLEMNIPMVVALNMMDELTGNGGSIDVNLMEEMLGVPVVPISAAKNFGVEELITHAIHVTKYRERPLRQDFCSQDDNGGAVHRCLHGVVHLIEDHAARASLPLRFSASKAVEGDRHIIDRLKLDENEQKTLGHITLQMEEERGLDRGAAIADMRFSYISRVCRCCVNKPVESKEHARSRQLDRILTGKYTAIPVFIGIMALVFYLTFSVVGAFLQGLMELLIERLTLLTDSVLQSSGVNPALRDLVINGVFGGLGSVLSFLPIVVVMFFFLSLLEDSGYIARVAFFMDKLFRKIGLSGRSIVPMIIGFGCTVPAVMSTRTLPSERDRKMTILLTPFMSCTAKLPIYAFFVNSFFPEYGGPVMTLLYLLGIVLGIAAAFIYKKLLFTGEAVPFVMELPNYRLPSVRSSLQLMWEKARDFLQKAFSVILIAAIVVWFLQSFDIHFNMVRDSGQSIMAVISGLLVPAFSPLGLGDWKICTSLICGFMAKESVVSTLEVLFGNQGGVQAVLSQAAAASLLVFSLLYTPCVAAVASIRRELGARWAAFVVIWQCAVAWVAALVTYNIFRL